MSAHDYYQPHVTIGGRRLNETRGLAGLTPVANLAIKWGTTDWWGNVDPSRLSLTLLDPYGELLTVRNGVEVVLSADPDDRVLFRGILDGAKAELIEVQDRAGNRIPVWRVSVEAFDPLAPLAADRKNGPINLARNEQINRLHWGRSSILERLNDVQARSAAPIAWRYAAWMKLLDDTLAPQGDYPVLPYTLQQNVSVLTVLRRTARIEHPLARPYYDPASGQIQLITPPTAPALPTRNATVTTSGGKIVLSRAASTVPALELDGSMLEADGGKIALDLREYDSIGRCALKAGYTIIRPLDAAAGIAGTHYEIQEPTNQVALTSGLGEATTVELETDFIFTRNPNIPSGVYSGISTLLRATDQWRQLPKFTFSPPRTGPLTAPLDRLFRAAPAFNADGVVQAFVFVNTPLQWRGTAPSFGVVGGELRYTARSGWNVTCTPAPVPTQPNAGLTLGDVTLTTTIANAADRYTVADLQLL